MTNRSELFGKIKLWLQNNPKITTAILVGSAARFDHPSDEYSDYDLEIYLDNPAELADDEQWLTAFGAVWVVVRDSTDDGFPTRLVIFEDGIKVDFSLRSHDSFKKLIESGHRPAYYQAGFEFITDKQNLGSSFHALSFVSSKSIITEKEYRRVVEEFWFEAWHVAKYLKRGDLWTAKFRDAGLKAFLLQILEWHSQAINGNNQNTWEQGRFMREWVDDLTWQQLHHCFSHFDAKNSWAALLETIALFRRLALEVAEKSHFSYPEAVDHHLSSWISTQHPQ